MAEARLKVEDQNAKFSGDYVAVDGTLTATGIVTATAGIARLKVSTTSDIGGTQVGRGWTTGVVLLTAGQKHLIVTVGSTDYKIPVWESV
jgi:hypothetical protein